MGGGGCGSCQDLEIGGLSFFSLCVCLLYVCFTLFCPCLICLYGEFRDIGPTCGVFVSAAWLDLAILLMGSLKRDVLDFDCRILPVRGSHSAPTVSFY